VHEGPYGRGIQALREPDVECRDARHASASAVVLLSLNSRTPIVSRCPY
jgi:hypothetical protein